MYTKAIIPALFLAGQAVALPATTITLHSTITSTTIVPAVTDAAGSNPSNDAATPALFSPSAENLFLTTLSSFSDASPFGATLVTVTVTETQGVPYPVLITVTDYYCPYATAEVESSTPASSERMSVTVSSTASPASSSAMTSSETKSSSAPATTTKACVFPVPRKCDD
ncbi:hypothetical protein KCU91_g5904, partial [Aureobasidium melanogenum]